MRRFYKDVTVSPSPQPSPPSQGTRAWAREWAILLDGKPIQTPARNALALPSRALAEAVADEWREQGETIAPQTIPLTKLANTAIDRVAPDRDASVARTLAYGRNDLLCYRAEAPADLVRRQSNTWGPLLAWAAERYGARLKVGTGIAHIAQPEYAIAALGKPLARLDAFGLAVAETAAMISGSAVLALALIEGRLDAEAVFAAADLDENAQAERWGRDAEAEARRRGLAVELESAARFLALRNKS